MTGLKSGDWLGSFDVEAMVTILRKSRHHTPGLKIISLRKIPVWETKFF
jgi:hypothetical protein